jgi:hypothetical protein
VNRRAKRDGGVSWDVGRERCVASATIGDDGRGKRIARRGRGRTKTEAKNKLRQLLEDQEDGLVVANDGYTVAQAVEDWLTTSPTRLPTPSCCFEPSPNGHSGEPSATGPSKRQRKLWTPFGNRRRPAQPCDCPQLGLRPISRGNQGRTVVKGEQSAAGHERSECP